MNMVIDKLKPSSIEGLQLHANAVLGSVQPSTPRGGENCGHKKLRIHRGTGSGLTTPLYQSYQTSTDLLQGWGYQSWPSIYLAGSRC